MGRGLRSDAQENHDRIMTAAAAAFATPDADTSLRAIARTANVGIATVYRRFPTREDLVEAIYRSETTRLCESAQALLEGHSAIEALRRWMDLFVDYMITKQGLSDALPAILLAQEELRAHTRKGLQAAIEQLRVAAVSDGDLRDDVPADQIMLALGGVTLITAHERDRAHVEALLNLLLDGLRRR